MPKRKNQKLRPDEDERRQVRTMAGCGLTVKEIGLVLDCSSATVKRHYQRELDEGHPRALAVVAQAAFKMATSGNCPALTIFWLKVRGHWKEPRAELDVSVQNAEAVQEATGRAIKSGVYDDEAVDKLAQASASAAMVKRGATPKA